MRLEFEILNKLERIIMFCDDPFLFLFAGDSIKQDSFYQKDKIKNKPDAKRSYFAVLFLNQKLVYTNI